MIWKGVSSSLDKDMLVLLATVRRRTVGSRGKGRWLRALVTYVDQS